MATPPEPTTWTIHLAARHPGKAVMAVIVVLLGVSAIAALGAPTPVLVLAAVLLLGSIAEFLLPVTYRLDSRGAHARLLGSHRILAWERVRRVYLLPDGIKLSPLASQNLLESYRGVLLRTPDRTALLKQVQAWCKQAGVVPEIVEDGQGKS